MGYPRIAEKNGIKVLEVHDQPFIMLAGEVHNSNSSSVEYMEGVWKKALELGMNTLLVPVTWELIEPQEGSFDFEVVDGLIMQARRLGGKLGFLWFGSWKNAQCYYVPEWVKADGARFRRAEVAKGKHFVNLKDFYGMPYSTMSYLCEETKKADAKAFAALMRHLKEVDGEENTVITVQVENETGLMGAGREHSDQADALFAQPVPQAFADYMHAHVSTMKSPIREGVESGGPSGSWSEVFGDAADEIFSAYHIASYVNAVAEAGKAEYPLPMTVNCWLDKGERAGIFPTGGPVRRVLEVWDYCAPAIDIYSPDIYVPVFMDVCDEYYGFSGNPLYIPETATHSKCSTRLVYAVGHFHAVCYAPFGFEDMGQAFNDQQMALFGADMNDPAIGTPADVDEYRYFSLALQSMMPMLTEKYGTADLQAVCSERKGGHSMRFGDYRIDCRMREHVNGVCLALRESESTFYLLAGGCRVSFASENPKKPYIDIAAFEEGAFVNGSWKRGRRLNGDESALGVNVKEAALYRVKLVAYD